MNGGSPLLHLGSGFPGAVIILHHGSNVSKVITRLTFALDIEFVKLLSLGRPWLEVWRQAEELEEGAGDALGHAGLATLTCTILLLDGLSGGLIDGVEHHVLSWDLDVSNWSLRGLL